MKALSKILWNLFIMGLEFMPRKATKPGTGHAPNTPKRHTRSLCVALAVLALSTASQGVEFGPDAMFSLTGFAKAEVQRGTNHCPDCQWALGEDKQRQWADALRPGAEYKTRETNVTLFQPYFGAKYSLPGGFKASALLSQRWRDGKVDIPGFWYDKNIALSHEDYGRLAIGSMTTRAWSVADYPYGTNVGLADVWGSSGAGYGMLKNAVRYTSRIMDVAQGDLVLEATYDRGNTKFTKNKPRFWELWAQYQNGDLEVQGMYQDTRNGNPQAWGHGPFYALAQDPASDKLLGGSGQSIAMAMAKYQVDSRIEVSGGVRRNRWSGAYPVVIGSSTTAIGPQAIWNNMFNVDWNTNTPYSATSTDIMLGARYRLGKWSASTGMAYLGKASTANPSERGQSNSALVNTLGLNYDVGKGLQLYGLAGMVHYGKRGLSPMSMPGNSAFTNVDSRINTRGNWFGLGAVYVF
jgi:predicted porin